MDSIVSDNFLVLSGFFTEMSSIPSKEASNGSTAAATNYKADEKTVFQSNKPFIQLAVFTGCGLVCGFAFEKARGI